MTPGGLSAALLASSSSSSSAYPGLVDVMPGLMKLVLDSVEGLVELMPDLMEGLVDVMLVSLDVMLQQLWKEWRQQDHWSRPRPEDNNIGRNRNADESSSGLQRLQNGVVARGWETTVMRRYGIYDLPRDTDIQTDQERPEVVSGRASRDQEVNKQHRGRGDADRDEWSTSCWSRCRRCRRSTSERWTGGEYRYRPPASPSSPPTTRTGCSDPASAPDDHTCSHQHQHARSRNVGRKSFVQPK